MRSFIFGKKSIEQASLPYIIAEIGVNHEGKMDLAKRLVDLAKEGGADAVKFQSYKAETLASKNSPSYWDLKKEPTTSQYELFKKYDAFGKNEYLELYNYCKKVGVDFLSTPFDDEAIDFLIPLVDFFKIASADITNIPFLRKLAKTQKPIVLSTGASTLAEVDIAVNELNESGCKHLALLHCILNYPTEEQNANLGMIEGLMHSYPDLIIGYSDHVKPDEKISVLQFAYLKGARILEKHFTHDKTLPGNDHYHAMDVNDLRKFKEELTRIKRLEGGTQKIPLETEMPARKNARRSIVLKKNISRGEIIAEQSITYKRPAHGISPLFWDDVIGKHLNKDLLSDHLLKWSDLE